MRWGARGLTGVRQVDADVRRRLVSVFAGGPIHFCWWDWRRGDGFRNRVLQNRANFFVLLLFSWGYEEVLAFEGAEGTLEVVLDLGAVAEEVLVDEVVGVAGAVAAVGRDLFRCGHSILRV